MKIPVINASTKNPHIAFNFNIHAKNILHYKKLLVNPKLIKININKKEILKYYFLMHIFYTRNWLFSDYEKMQKNVKDHYDSEVYKYWVKNEFSTQKHREILDTLEKFVDSSDYRLTYKHLNKNILDDIG